MEFRIADTFTDSLNRLPNQEQKAAKTTAFDLQINPANPGLKFHRIDRAKDPHFWSTRVNRDLRIILHRTEGSILLCYVDHHDDAYHWAERRRLETHPRTGAAQLVEVRETVQEITVPVYVDAPAPPLFAHLTEEELLRYGVPPDWLADVQRATEQTLFDLAEHLPNEAAEALLELATGGRPLLPAAASTHADPFEHPDAQRRFRLMKDIEELQRALEFPWEKWTLFLHPEQRKLVERRYNGAVRVSGSAGTGKTIVALHRAAYLARQHPGARVLLTTFSEALAQALRTKLNRLVYQEPELGERVEVHALEAVGHRLYVARQGKPRMADRREVETLLAEASAMAPDHNFTLPFLMMEWEHVVDAWQLNTWEEYRDFKRLGLKRRLNEAKRTALWAIFQDVRGRLKGQGAITPSALFAWLANHFAEGHPKPYDFVVVDEAQDIGVAQLCFLSALAGSGADRLMLTGDLGQRIFQPPFSWKSVGINIQGRSHTLRVNYRTSHQIRAQADRLLDQKLSDADGHEETRETVSVFNGPPPTVRVFDTAEEESEAVAAWLRERLGEGMTPPELGIIVRSEAELDRAVTAAVAADIPHYVLDDDTISAAEKSIISTMHLAKGLEFRAVAVMACDDEVLPLQSRIETAGEESDLEEVYHTERHLLYVACTRARDCLLITSTDPPSEFIEDL